MNAVGLLQTYSVALNDLKQRVATLEEQQASNNNGTNGADDEDQKPPIQKMKA